MLFEIRHRTDPAVATVCCVGCEVCRREGPRVPLCQRDPDHGQHPAEEAAKAEGWVVHMEIVRTAIRKRATGSWCIQYFCPEHKDKAGKVPAIRETRTSKKTGKADLT